MSETPDNPFNRYATPAGDEGEYEPGSRGRVLRNKLGIKSKREMDWVEMNALLVAQRRWWQSITSDTRFTAKMLCQMHRDWLGEIYSWAGEYRKVNLAKGSFRWPPCHLIASHMDNLTVGLLKEFTPCRQGSLESVANRIARIHAELLLIHPFREGNGRVARWLADLMAAQAGFPTPSYGFTGIGSKEQKVRYLNAVMRGYIQDYDALSSFFRDILASVS